MDKITKKILLIEDELYLRDIYQSVLSKHGFEVLLASDGIEGFNKALSEIPRLILLDIMLPKNTGLEVLKKLKTNPQTNTIPVILITNLGQREVIKEAFTLGAQGYLLKVNLKPQTLVEQVDYYLQNPNFKIDINQVSLE